MRLHHDALRWLLVGAVAVALLAATYGVASAPTRTAGRLGLRGFKRQRALEGDGAWPQVEPVVRWLGVRLSGVLSDGAHASLDRQIALAGDYLGLTPEEYVALSVLSAVGGLFGGALLGLATGSPGLLALVCVPLGAALPYLVVTGEAQHRLKQIGRGLPYAIDLMALAMSAGLDFPGAVRQVVEKSSDPDDPLVEELTRVLQQFQLGRTRKQTLLELADRAPSPAVGEFVSAVVQAEERGNPVAEVLIIQAEASRTRRSVKAEEAAAKAGVAMVLPLFLLFGCIMLLVMAPMLLRLASIAE